MTQLLTEAPGGEVVRGGIMPTLMRTLRQHSVTLIDNQRIWLRCDECGQVWSPNLLSGGRLPKGYWKCPNGCNIVVNQK